MKKLIALAALLAGAAQTTHAEFKSGNTLLNQLRGDTTDYIHAIGYVTGVYDALQGVIHCPPGNVNAGQVTDMVKNFLEASPEIRHHTADRIISVVLKRAWPCANERGGRSL